MDDLLPALEDSAAAHEDSRRVTIAAAVVQGILLTFALVVILMPPFIALLRRLGFGKRIREEGPGTHMVKEGTPTMGGVLMIVVVAASAALFHFVGEGEFLRPQHDRADPDAAAGRLPGRRRRLPQLDHRRGHPHPPEAAVADRRRPARSPTRSSRRTTSATLTVPFVGDVPIEPWAYIFFAAFAIVATTNGVNFTDGLDGLAGGTLIFAFVAYMIIALLAGQTEPRRAVRAVDRRPARLPVVQRPPGADLHGRFGIARLGRDAWR